MGEITTRLVVEQSYDTYVTSLRPSETPLLLKLSFKLTGDPHGKACISFVIDHSDSMRESAGGRWEGSKDAAVRRTLAAIAKHFDAQDRVGLIGFNHTTTDVSDGLVAGPAFAGLVDAVPPPTGGTVIAWGLSAAVAQLAAHGDADVPKAIVLLTDGATFYPEQSEPAAREAAEAGIELIVLAYGTEPDHNHLNDVVKAGGGRYAWVEDEQAGLEHFLGAVRHQQRAVGAAVTLHGTLNTQDVRWLGLRSLLPQKLGRKDVLVIDGKALDGRNSGRFEHFIGNVEPDVPHALLLDCEPRTPKAGQMMLGTFELFAGNRRLTDPVEITLSVSDTELPRTTNQSNGSKKLLHAYNESRVPELGRERDQAIAAGDEGRVMALWTQILEYLKRVADEDAHAEQEAAFREWAGKRGLSPERAKRAHEQTSNTDSVSAQDTAQALERATPQTSTSSLATSLVKGKLSLVDRLKQSGSRGRRGRED